MQTLLYILGILVLIAGIGISVALHELGHMIPAKFFGVKVPEYFIGFGPRIWSTKRGETEYGIKAIWLGGYVRLLGMIPPAPPGRTDKPGSAIAEAREQSLAELEPGEEHRAFYRLSVPKKLVVMAGGILTNLVLGVGLLAMALGGIGQPAMTTTLSTVTQCVPADIDSLNGTTDREACAEGNPVSPAAAAGLQAGDTITSWNGQEVRSWNELSAAIAASGTQPLVVEYERDGQEYTATLTPIELERAQRHADGTVVTDAAGQPLTGMRPYAGLSPSLGTVRASGGEIASQVGSAVGQTLKAIVTIPAGLYHAGAAALGLEERDASGLMSLVGVGRIAGEISSVGAGSGTVPVAVRLFGLVSLLGSLNLALFAFNLIPLLPLDGGHIAGALYEGAHRQIARLCGKPDPGYADVARLIPVGQVVFILLILMAVVLMWADIASPVGATS